MVTWYAGKLEMKKYSRRASLGLAVVGGCPSLVKVIVNHHGGIVSIQKLLVADIWRKGDMEESICKNTAWMYQ